MGVFQPPSFRSIEGRKGSNCKGVPSSQIFDIPTYPRRLSALRKYLQYHSGKVRWLLGHWWLRENIIGPVRVEQTLVDDILRGRRRE